LKYLKHKKLILIAASTGGPTQIELILNSLDDTFDATIVVAQHLGEAFIPSFIKRMSFTCKKKVSLAQDKVKCGEIFIVPSKTVFIKQNNEVFFTTKTDKSKQFSPDINQLFISALDIVDMYDITVIILTGIGDDGVKGASMLSNAGCRCIAESQKDAIVYGMPARAKERVANIKIKDLDEIVEIVKNV